MPVPLIIVSIPYFLKIKNFEIRRASPEKYFGIRAWSRMDSRRNKSGTGFVCSACCFTDVFFHQNIGEKNIRPKLYTRELLTEKMEFDCRYYLDFVSEREKVKKKKKYVFLLFLYGNISFYRALERTTTRWTHWDMSVETTILLSVLFTRNSARVRTAIARDEQKKWTAKFVTNGQKEPKP